MTYEQYIASAIWDAKRKARLALDHSRCRLCDEDGTRFALQVHHRPGSYARVPHESVEDDLITVCARCHEFITTVIREDRFGSRATFDVSILETTVQQRQAITHGMANSSVQVDILSPVAHAQRTNCGPDQQVGQIDQEDLWQTQQDRRRL